MIKNPSLRVTEACESEGRLWSSQSNMGRDELNFAEFPLTLLADRAPAHLKTIQFSDRIFDKSQRVYVTRRLTVTGSDRYGLPTALDDEVILGLVQLAHERHFASRVISFSRHELLRLLGWRNEGKSYRRLNASLRRWLGVTLYYENAWRDKENAAWVDEHFHLLERVTIRKNCSTVTWNEVPFRSFQAGNLKKLNMDRYRCLKLAVSKRLYRFLDKRFYHRKRLIFDLKRLAFEHLGLSRAYSDAGQLKRRLKPAVVELEGAGFLVPLAYGERFAKQRRGQWSVTFLRASEKSRRSCKSPDLRSKSLVNKTVQKLMNRGIAENVAISLSRGYSADVVEKQLDAFDWLIHRKDLRVSRNPAGFLVASIRDDYDLPPGYSPQASRYVVTSENYVDARTPQPSSVREVWEDQAEAVWSGLCDDQRKRLDSEALKQASPFLRRRWDEAERSDAEIARFYRQAIRRQYMRKLLAKNGHH